MIKRLMPSTASSIRGHQVWPIDGSPPMANEWLAQLFAIARLQQRKGQAGNLAKQRHLPVQVRRPPARRRLRCLFKSFIILRVKQENAFVLAM
jgi:hypothetical protein